MAVSKRTRYEVLKRDNYTCRYCGATAPEAKLTVDHVTPVALGGSDAAENLVCACSACNAGKSSTLPDAPLVADVRQDEMRWASAIKRAAALREAERGKESAYVLAFETKWTSWSRCVYNLDSVARLYESGLPIGDVLDAVEIATQARGVNSRFAYFMGICWKRLAKLQDVAKEILAAEANGDG